MEYWNLTSRGGRKHSLSLGTQYRVFSNGIRKYDETKDREVKRSKKESKESDKETTATVSPGGETKAEENVKEEGQGAETPSGEAGVHPDGTGAKTERVSEKSDPIQRERDHPEPKEEKQEDSQDNGHEQ